MSSISSSNRYSIVEPHPSVPASHYFTTGRGGAGNRVKAPNTVTRGSDASGPAARINLAAAHHNTAQPKTFTTGRGGAGNVHPSSERAIFSFDEELERQLSQDRHAAPVYHVGRGGAGNISSSSSAGSSSSQKYATGSVSSWTSQRRRSTDRASFASSASTSSESGADYVNRNLKKGFKKMLGSGY
ncbi:hypothetical protein LTR84_011611 [Exophiala bonariae]|uniref:Uncharacterized protein n=1 Tax=Exophiala bonariae TaxID=1690606 RepID=A0AAV9NGX1_9EURO|nr:hypothetical protein LTR84_011611 [Exophiala bonariae]